MELDFTFFDCAQSAAIFVKGSGTADSEGGIFVPAGRVDFPPWFTSAPLKEREKFLRAIVVAASEAIKAVNDDEHVPTLLIPKAKAQESGSPVTCTCGHLRDDHLARGHGGILGAAIAYGSCYSCACKAYQPAVSG